MKLNRKILLRLALLLITAVLADKLWISAGVSPAEAEARIAFLRAQLANAPRESDVAELEQRLAQARAHITAPVSVRRQYLESLIGQDFIVSVEPTAPTPVPDWPGRSVVSFKLRLRMTLEDLLGSLAALDADNQPMRIERLRILPADEHRRILQVEMTVTTLTDTTAPVAVATTTAATLVPEKRRPPEQLAKNIFFPVVVAAQTEDVGALTVRDFILVAVEASGPRPRAMLLQPPSGETAWIEPGAAIDSARLERLDAESALFSIGDDKVRLAIGDPSAMLMVGKRIFSVNCTLIGVLREGRRWLAMARFPGRDELVMLGVGDVLPTGRIVAIGEESITLDRGGYEDIVRVGQGSDTPVYPGMGLGFE